MTLAAAVSQASVGGVMVSIVAFQAIDPGSIPGQRSFFVFHFKRWLQGAFMPSGRVGFDSRSMQLFFLIPFYTIIQVKVQLVVILCMLDWT